MALTIDGTNGIETNTDTGRIKVGASDDLSLYHGGTDSVINNATGHFYIQGENQLTIKANNNVEILKATGDENMAKFIPDGAVELYHNNAKTLNTSTIGVQIKGGNTGTETQLQIHGNEGQRAVIALAADDGDDNADYWQFQARPDGNLNIQTYASGSWANSLLLQSGAAAKLYYNGDEKFATTSTGALITSNGSNNGLMVNHSNGNEVARLAHNGSGDEGVLQLKDSNSTQINLNAEIGQKSYYTAGSFILGNAGASVGTSQRGIELDGRTDSNPVFIKTSSGHYTGGAYSHWQFYDDHGNVGWVMTDGDGTASYNSASDYRLKENVVAITDGIAKVKQLKPYRFNFKTAGTSQVVQGFFAHEVSPVVPNAVDGAKDAIAAEDNENTGHKKGDPIYQGLDTAKMVPILTAALQEAITKIETLETKVAALEAA